MVSVPTNYTVKYLTDHLLMSVLHSTLTYKRILIDVHFLQAILNGNILIALNYYCTNQYEYTTNT